MWDIKLTMVLENPGFLSLYNFFRFVFNIVVKIFFRDIQVIGEHNIPSVNPISY